MISRIVPLPPDKSFFLLGPRQTGKSTLINHFLQRKKHFSIDLLHSEVMLRYLREPATFRKEADYAIGQGGIDAVFVDEIQKVPALLDEIQALISTYPKVQFIASGSSARKLKRGAANLLAGRLLQRYLYPFVFAELKHSFTLDVALRFGSLPPVIGASEQSNKDFLLSYVNTYLREEIQAEGIVRNLGAFSRFLEIVAVQNGEIVNFSAIARDSGMPSRTVHSYYEILEDTLTGFRIEAWRKSVRKRLLSHPKFYLFDVGVSNALARRFGHDSDPLTRGRLFEQWIVTETHRLFSYIYPEMRLFYWRTSAGAEVDLLFEEGGKIVAACDFKTVKAAAGTHMRGLYSFSEEHPGVPLYLVCDCSKPYLDNGVEVLPWIVYLERLAAKKLF